MEGSFFIKKGRIIISIAEAHTFQMDDKVWVQTIFHRVATTSSSRLIYTQRTQRRLSISLTTLIQCRQTILTQEACLSQLLDYQTMEFQVISTNLTKRKEMTPWEKESPPGRYHTKMTTLLRTLVLVLMISNF